MSAPVPAEPTAAAGVSIDELVLADSPEAWRALGFTVQDDSLVLGALRLRLAGEQAGRGIISWSLRQLTSTQLDGLPTSISDAPPRALGLEHANGITAIDHIVAMTPALDRTVPALQAAGLDLRRIRDEPTPAGAPRQAFFRLGQEILEVVQEPEHAIERHGRPDRSARFWGLALIAPQLERTVAALGEYVGEPRPAVQQGRQIATIKRSAGLAVPVALISPKP
jgi:hypothetical protein